MLVQFKHPRKLHHGKECKLYTKGFHEIPDASSDDWYFKALVKVGDVSVGKPAEVAAPAPSLEEKAKAKMTEKAAPVAEKKAPSQPQKKG